MMLALFPYLTFTMFFLPFKCQVMEIETEEGLRRAELAQADRDTTYKFNREVRREKSHWKIESNRKNVILRNRPRYQAIVAQVRHTYYYMIVCTVCIGHVASAALYRFRARS